MTDLKFIFRVRSESKVIKFLICFSMTNSHMSILVALGFVNFFSDSNKRKENQLGHKI